jgi:hypothetical protein
MKVNSTLVLTLILLLMMLGAGFVSGMWGFAVGHTALKGVTQPDIRPTNKLITNKQTTSGKAGLDILREEDILASVKAQRNGKAKASKANKNNDEAKTSSDSGTEKTAAADSSQENKVASFQQAPLKSDNQGVTLQVLSARQEAGSLLLNVTMKNAGASSVRFLYSFLNVTDDQGRTLSATTDGLPGELPPNGQEFSGTVSIPTALLEDAKKLSLKLTDYPDQKLQLQISDIPVMR